jgi:hypothetical protein
MRRRLLVGVRGMGRFALILPLLLTLAALEGCAGSGATPFTLSYPAATAGADPVPISLVDQTGLVTAMTFATADLASPGVEAAPGQPDVLRVSWQGGPCDDRSTLVLNDVGGGRYELAIHNHPPITAGMTCDATTATRTVDITFRSQLDPGQLTLNVTYP